MMHLFFELIQIALANRKCFNRPPSDIEWKCLYEMACKQSLGGVLLNGVNRQIESGNSSKPPMIVLYEWIGLQQHTVAHNKLQNQRTKELCELFKEHGYRSCILKGQGTALYYDHPEYRQCGDIDIWVDGDRDEILRFAKSKNYHVGHIDIKHSDIDFFKDVPVEVHLKSLKMSSFVGGIMWILKECFGMKEEYLLCVVNIRHGEYLLSEIMTAGNFGQYDDRMLRIDKNQKFKRGLVQLKRNLRFVSYYPSEVLWSPFWKLWHWGWRKQKGYL